MDLSERRARIRSNLSIEAISHGEVYTFQVAIPESEQESIIPEKLQLIEDAFIQHQNNLIPIIIRPTEAYSEEEEYELVYGADWCFAAKELDIEKLWAWVFNLTDKQAAAIKEEMQQLLSSSSSITEIASNISEDNQSIQPLIMQIDKLSRQVTILNRMMERVTGSIKKLEDSQNNIQTKTDEKVIQQLFAAIKNIEDKLHKPPETIDYEKMPKYELEYLARKLNIKGRSKMKTTGELITAIKKAKASNTNSL
ncbi:MAG: hypothetical protein KI793_01825 [Rivularia sp. (in: Bacteria)]|nr:hypothetical protein [Rivularia sp. MS3]